MRSADIDRSADVWVYRPATHKNASRGKDRAVAIGPKAQAVLAPFIAGRDPAAYLFTPADSLAWRRAERTKARRTPLSCGNVPGSNVAARPRWRPGDRYRTGTYGGAIAKACDRAFPAAGDLAWRDRESAAAWAARLSDEQRGELARWQERHRWAPNRLRHAAATEFQNQFGIERARVLLGHSKVSTTALYAERDDAAAADAARQVG